MQPTPLTDFDIRTLKGAAHVLANPAIYIAQWVDASLNNTLHEVPSFTVYCDLTTVGPKNDNNGARSRAEELKLRFDLEILAEAQRIVREKRAAA
jgi:hypothetical protein